MSSVRLGEGPAELTNADLLLVPFFAGKEGVRLAAPGSLDGTPWQGVAEAALRRDARFTAAPAEVAASLLAGSTGPDLLAVGLGAEASLSGETIRAAAMAASRTARGRKRIASLLALCGPDRADSVRAAAEGALLGGFRFQHGKPPETAGETVLVLRPGEAASAPVARALEIARSAGETANWVRSLVETPPRELPPAGLAEAIVARARAAGIAAEVWSGDALRERGFGGTLAVGAGSEHPPAVVVLRAKGSSGAPLLGLAGKGITFDSGGINLKRNLGEIFRMKSDMTSAAAVAGALIAAVSLGARPNVLAVLPLAENMPGSRAQRPGDVIVHPDGQRTEVVDTDCEGRLILADALAWLRHEGVAAMIDVGTLTDGGGVGPLLWGCWSTDDTLCAETLAAGTRAGEPGWRLPLRAEYRRYLDSRIADIANAPLDTADIGLIAATYLRAFAAETPWVHIDNGSSAFLEHDIGGWPLGATAAPMRALMQLLLDRG
jgi:leucyl aminopeptidase